MFILSTTFPVSRYFPLQIGLKNNCSLYPISRGNCGWFPVATPGDDDRARLRLQNGAPFPLPLFTPVMFFFPLFFLSLGGALQHSWRKKGKVKGNGGVGGFQWITYATVQMWTYFFKWRRSEVGAPQLSKVPGQGMWIPYSRAAFCCHNSGSAAFLPPSGNTQGLNCKSLNIYCFPSHYSLFQFSF